MTEKSPALPGFFLFWLNDLVMFSRFVPKTNFAL